MSAHCCEHKTPTVSSIQNLGRYRRILWIALIINAVMFLVEILAGYTSGSLSLLADAIDFAGDAANYAVSLAVLSAALAWRARAAMLKAFSMIAFGLFILVRAGWATMNGAVPDAPTMGLIGFLALVANVTVAWMLYAFREGDANMRSVWLCSRNDAIGNLAVMAAAVGVFGTGQAWPDAVVAAIMSSLALHGGWQVLRQARAELASDQPNHEHRDVH
jgi:cation diffusion facilitator family transporter